MDGRRRRTSGLPSTRRTTISRDGLSLYFSSKRPDGHGGLDLYVAHRAATSAPWGPAQNLGPTLNSERDDNAVVFSRDGRTLFFGSGRAGGCGGDDVWMA